MKKRILNFALAICLLVPCLIGLSACDNNVNTKTVIKEQWNEAMSFDYDNYAINFTYTDYQGENIIKVKKDGEDYYYYEVDFDSSVEEEYCRKYGDMYLTYSLNSDQTYSLSSDENRRNYNDPVLIDFGNKSFGFHMFNYNDFSYNETNECYEAEKIIVFNVHCDPVFAFYGKDCSLSFENGKLKTLKYTMPIGMGYGDSTYTYTFDYGITIDFPQQLDCEIVED